MKSERKNFYKFREDLIIEEMLEYITSTYEQHYAVGDKMQSLEKLDEKGMAFAFCFGNVQKYWDRYGLKDGYNEKDLIKIIHYAMLALHFARKEDESKTQL